MLATLVSAAAAVALAVAPGAGCATTTTEIEQTWQAPSAAQTRFTKVLAVYAGKDVTVRRSAEDRLVQRLAAQGVTARPAYAVLTDAEIANLDAAKTKLRAQGFDGVVAMRVVDRETQVEYSPGTFDGYWGVAWPYWGYGYGYGYPGYAYTETIVRIETTAYSLDTNKLVWSALSATTDPASVGEMMNDVTQVVATELGRRGVVASRVPPPPPPARDLRG